VLVKFNAGSRAPVSEKDAKDGSAEPFPNGFVATAFARKLWVDSKKTETAGKKTPVAGKETAVFRKKTGFEEKNAVDEGK
jgi:hypothetical protein